MIAVLALAIGCSRQTPSLRARSEGLSAGECEHEEPSEPEALALIRDALTGGSGRLSAMASAGLASIAAEVVRNGGTVIQDEVVTLEREDGHWLCVDKGTMFS